MYVPLAHSNEAQDMAPFHVFFVKSVIIPHKRKSPGRVVLTYVPFGRLSARQQNAAFHEKGKVFATKQINSLKIIFNFGQYEKINDHIDRSTGLLDDRIGGGGTEKRIQGRRDT